MRTFRTFIGNLRDQIKTDRTSFIVYSILRALVLATMVRCIFTGSYESVALCILSLILFYIPPAFEKGLGIEIPTLFENIVYLFIFAAEILGEINHYYVLIPGWDTMLHTMNGFLCAVVGFSLIDLLNQKSKEVELSPLYLSIVAFCFSMTIGVLWEFFEFSMDYFFLFDMQKDFIISQFGSVTLDPNQMGAVVTIKNITDTVIHTADAQTITISGGYLDIGILDTMKDLFVNFIGAVVFSVIGFLYVRNRDNHKSVKRIAEGLVIRKSEDDQILKRD